MNSNMLRYEIRGILGIKKGDIKDTAFLHWATLCCSPEPLGPLCLFNCQEHERGNGKDAQPVGLQPEEVMTG